MAFAVNKKAFCVLEFAKTESIVTVQRRLSYTTQNHLQTKQFVNGTSIPAEWLPVRWETNRPSGPIGPEQNAFLFTVNAIFLHDYALAVETGSTPRPLVPKKWKNSLPFICSFLPCLYWLLRSSEIPEGLMNNPVLQDVQCTYNVIPRRFRLTVFLVEKEYILQSQRVSLQP